VFVSWRTNVLLAKRSVSVSRWREATGYMTYASIRSRSLRTTSANRSANQTPSGSIRSYFRSRIARSKVPLLCRYLRIANAHGNTASTKVRL
jgi:hypothetical protein